MVGGPLHPGKDAVTLSQSWHVSIWIRSYLDREIIRVLGCLITHIYRSRNVTGHISV